MSEPNKNELYLVEIWQNYNGYKLTWHEVMLWTGAEWVLYSDPIKKLGPTQSVRRWAQISSITCWEENFIEARQAADHSDGWWDESNF